MCIRDRVHSLCWRDKNGTIQSNPAAELMDMAQLPFPYPDIDQLSGRILYFESIRGCPFRCSYCLSSVAGRVRYLPLELTFQRLQRFLDASCLLYTSITIKKQANTKERRRTNIKPSFDDKQKSTLKIIDSSIASCEKVRGKLKEGSSQLSLNTNRLQALYLAKEILQNTDSQQIEQALIQITSIRRKSETGLAHAKSGSATYTRFRRLVEAMDVVLQGLETAKKKKDKL